MAPGGAAERAGVELGDELVEIAGRAVATLGDLEQVLGTHVAGQATSVTVLRTQETVTVELTFGGEDRGRASIGASFAVMGDLGSGDTPRMAEDGLERQQCLDWIAEAYGFETLPTRLGLDLGEDIAVLRSCMARDVELMSEPIPFGWCDNVFKIHCSGLDLIAEIGEAQVDWCEERLSEGYMEDLSRQPVWTDCARDAIFDRYSLNGQAGELTCRAAFRQCRQTSE